MPRKKATKRVLDIVETKLGKNQSLGLWMDKGKNGATIAIDERLRGFQRLMIILHEALHEVCRDWSEEKVVATSEILSSILWRCDYRHVDHAGEDKPSYKVSYGKKPSKRKVITRKIYEEKS